MGAYQRRKGHDFERKIAGKLADALKVPVLRNRQERGSGKDGADIRGLPFHIECKKHKRTNIKAAIEQAIAQHAPGKTPVAITQDDRGRILVTMELHDWLDFVKEWWECR
jgi:hypothetical protein